MNPTSFSCPHCSGVFQTDTEQPAVQVLCPHCDEMVDLPNQSSSNPDTAADSAPDKSASEENPGKRKRRSRKKSSAPGTMDDNHLFPPGYVPESVAEKSTESADKPPPSMTTSADNVPDRTPQQAATVKPDAVQTDTQHADMLPAPVKPVVDPSPEPVVDQPAEPLAHRQPDDSLLPPTIHSTSANQLPHSSSDPESVPSATNPQTADHLLPPSVADSHKDPTTTTETLFTGIDIPNTSGPTDLDIDAPRMVFREPVKVAVKGNQEVELKQRTAEERQQWKHRKNLVLWITGILIVLITMLVMAQ